MQKDDDASCYDEERMNLAEMKAWCSGNDQYSVATGLLPFARIFLAPMGDR